MLANVGLYSTPNNPLVPDVMLGLDVRSPEDVMVKGHRAWFTWIIGKAPEVAVEIVSNREGGEDSTKLLDYARMGVPYYVIYDPENLLGKGTLRGYGLREGKYEPIDPGRLPQVGLGLRLWQGHFEDMEGTWLRWCDDEGNWILTGAERTEQEHQARVQAEQRVARLEAQLRAQGIEPSS